jgi:uncharacterized damage-inducible protein DinB
MIELLREHVAYHREATEALLAQVTGLTPEQFSRVLVSSFPSVRSTLVHVLRADTIWLSRVEGWALTADDLPRLDAFATPGEMEAAFEGVLNGWRRALAARQGNDLIEFRTLSNNERHSEELQRIVRHVVNHATYHYGQVVTLMRQVGAGDIPALDIIP